MKLSLAEVHFFLLSTALKMKPPYLHSIPGEKCCYCMTKFFLKKMSFLSPIQRDSATYVAILTYLQLLPIIFLLFKK